MTTINTIEFTTPQSGRVTIYHRDNNLIDPIWEGYVSAGRNVIEFVTPFVIMGTLNATLIPDSIEVKIFTKTEKINE
jgi:hypothetical protein